jgi:hypothetical protein
VPCAHRGDLAPFDRLRALTAARAGEVGGRKLAAPFPPVGKPLPRRLPGSMVMISR